MHYFKIFSISRLIKSEGNLFFKFNGENYENSCEVGATFLFTLL